MLIKEACSSPMHAPAPVPVPVLRLMGCAKHSVRWNWEVYFTPIVMDGVEYEGSEIRSTGPGALKTIHPTKVKVKVLVRVCRSPHEPCKAEL